MINIDAIQKYFESNKYPNQDIELRPGMYVLCIDAEKFVSSMIKILKAHPMNDGYMAYYEHLLNYYNKAKNL